MRSWISDALIVLGLLIMTLGVYGVVRLPDVYTKLHASGKASFLGVSVLLLTGWTVAVSFGATTLQPVVFAWIFALVGGTVVVLGGHHR